MEKKLEKFKLDPTLNWEFAEILNIDDFQINFKTLNKNKKRQLMAF